MAKIEVYPVKIEAVMDHDPLFCIESFDEYSATLRMDVLLTPNNLDDLFAAIRKGFDLLELLDPGKDKPYE